jgi:hypothetical protein
MQTCEKKFRNNNCILFENKELFKKLGVLKIVKRVGEEEREGE